MSSQTTKTGIAIRTNRGQVPDSLGASADRTLARQVPAALFPLDRQRREKTPINRDSPDVSLSRYRHRYRQVEAVTLTFLVEWTARPRWSALRIRWLRQYFLIQLFAFFLSATARSIDACGLPGAGLDFFGREGRCDFATFMRSVFS